MSKRKKILLWLGLMISIPAGGYTGVSFIFYSWLSAAEPERWPPERAGIWAGSAFLIALLFLVLFIYCLVSLIKETNRKYREQQNRI